MRYKKIRGLARRKKDIEKWRQAYLELDLDKLKDKHYHYVKIWVDPWSSLRYKDRNYRGPSNDYRNQILNALIDVYESWDLQLKSLGVPYYLKIWLYDPRFTSSEVVCGIGDRIEHYNSIFYSDKTHKDFPSEKFTKAERISLFKFEQFVDEEWTDDKEFPNKELYEDEKDYYRDQKHLTKLRNGKARIQEIEFYGEKYNRYLIPKGQLWVGAK